MAAAACRPSDDTGARNRIEGGLVSPRGDWVLHRVSRSNGAAAAFLKNLKSGREVPLGRGPAGEPSQRSFAFSEDGSRAAWLREGPRLGRATLELVSLDLNKSDAAPAQIRDALDVVHEMNLSPDGRRAALLAGRVLEVIDASTGEAAAARELPDWRVPRSLYFAPDGHLRLYPRSRLDPPSSSAQDLLELDPATGELVATGRVAVDSSGTLFRPAAAGGVAILLDGSRSRIALCDAQTGEERAVLPRAGELRGAGFLAGGRIAAVYRAESGGTAVRVFDGAGKELAALDLASKPAAVAVLGEPAAGRLLVATNPVGANSTKSWSVLALDLPNRRVARTWPGLAPLDPLEFWTAPALEEVSRKPSVLLLDLNGKVVTVEAS